MEPTRDKLKSKQALFCEEYIKDFNATRAAIAAGYSKKTAYSQGQRLLKHVEIRKTLSVAMEQRLKKVGVDAEWVLRELVNQYKVGMGDFVKIDGAGNPSFDFSQSSKEQWGAIYSFQIDSSREAGVLTPKIKLSLNNKLKILEAIGKHVDVGAFREKIELTGKDQGPIEIKDPRQVLRDRVAGVAGRIEKETDT